MSEPAAVPNQSVFFDGPRGVAIFADLFGKAYVCWTQPKPIGAAVSFDVVYGDETKVEDCKVAVKIVKAVTQAEVEAIARRLSPEEKLARGHWYEVTPE